MRGGRRVAVTGIGVVAAAGIGVDAFWSGLLGTPPDGAREVLDWDPSPWFGPKVDTETRLSPLGRLAAAAACGDSSRE